jgi:hypothetical protein
VGKYSALRGWLRASGKPAVTVSFDEPADIIPGGLPPSAYNYRPWWGNETSPGRPNARKAGWLPGTWWFMSTAVLALSRSGSGPNRSPIAVG